jgi:hypothetical protein
VVPRGHRSRLPTPYDACVAGELLPIGTRPHLVASFDPPGADAAFRAWRERNAEALATVPPEAFRVEYGRAQAGGLYVRVRVSEEHAVSAGLASETDTGH